MVRTAWIILAVLAAAGVAAAQATMPMPATRPAPATQPAADEADAPTYITLHVKGAKGSDVLKEVSRQAKVHVQGWPDFFWNGQQPGIIPLVTIDLDHVTFWNAIEAICKITHSHPQYIGQPNDIALAMGNPGNWDQEGQFAFVPQGINRSSEVDLTTGSAHKTEMLTLSVYVDPRVHVTRWDLPRLTVAEDELGNSLLPVGPIDPNLYPAANQQPWTVDASVPLTFPAHFGNRLARLEGTVTIHLSDRLDMLQFKDLAKAIGNQATVGDHRVDVLAYSFDGNATVSLHLKISQVASDGKPKGPPNLLQEFRSLRVIDAAGQQMPPVGDTVRSDHQLDWTGTFTASRPAKAPFALRWPIPTHLDPLVVPFKFKDLPLPH